MNINFSYGQPKPKQKVIETINKKTAALEEYNLRRNQLFLNIIYAITPTITALFPDKKGLLISIPMIMAIAIISNISINRMNYLNEKYRLGFKKIEFKPPEDNQN